MAKVPERPRPENLPNIDITNDAEGNQYIRHFIRPVAPVAFAGRLGSDIEIAEVGRDNKVRGVFSMATDWKGYGDEARTTAWLRVTVWNGAASAMAQNLNRGDQVIITAELITTLIACDSKGRVLLTEAGQPRIITEVTVDNFQLLGNRRSTARNAALNVEDEDADEDYGEEAVGDIPF